MNPGVQIAFTYGFSALTYYFIWRFTRWIPAAFSGTRVSKPLSAVHKVLLFRALYSILGIGVAFSYEAFPEGSAEREARPIVNHFLVPSHNKVSKNEMAKIEKMKKRIKSQGGEVERLDETVNNLIKEYKLFKDYKITKHAFGEIDKVWVLYAPQDANGLAIRVEKGKRNAKKGEKADFYEQEQVKREVLTEVEKEVVKREVSTEVETEKEVVEEKGSKKAVEKVKVPSTTPNESRSSTQTYYPPPIHTTNIVINNQEKDKKGERYNFKKYLYIGLALTAVAAIAGILYYFNLWNFNKKIKSNEINNISIPPTQGIQNPNNDKNKPKVANDNDQGKGDESDSESAEDKDKDKGNESDADKDDLINSDSDDKDKDKEPPIDDEVDNDNTTKDNDNDTTNETQDDTNDTQEVDISGNLPQAKFKGAGGAWSTGGADEVTLSKEASDLIFARKRNDMHRASLAVNVRELGSEVAPKKEEEKIILGDLHYNAAEFTCNPDGTLFYGSTKIKPEEYNGLEVCQMITAQFCKSEGVPTSFFENYSRKDGAVDNFNLTVALYDLHKGGTWWESVYLYIAEYSGACCIKSALEYRQYYFKSRIKAPDGTFKSPHLILVNKLRRIYTRGRDFKTGSQTQKSEKMLLAEMALKGNRLQAIDEKLEVERVSSGAEYGYGSESEIDYAEGIISGMNETIDATNQLFDLLAEFEREMNMDVKEAAQETGIGDFPGIVKIIQEYAAACEFVIKDGKLTKEDEETLALWMEAATCGKKQQIEELCNIYGNNIIETCAQGGSTALHWGAFNGDLEMVKLLVQKGADINHKTDQGISTLSISVQQGHLEVIRYLIEQGADIHAKNEDGYTAFHWSVEGGHIDVVKYFVEQGTDIGLQGINGNTPLHFSAEKGYLDCLKYLCEQGADIHAKNKWGYTALLASARAGHLDCVKYLHRQGCDVNSSNKKGHTALLASAKNGHLDCLKYLIQQGAKINEKSKDGFTALMCAATEGYLDMVKWLVGQGADINAQNTDGDTALSLSKSKGHSEVVQCLEDESGLVKSAVKLFASLTGGNKTGGKGAGSQKAGKANLGGDNDDMAAVNSMGSQKANADAAASTQAPATVQQKQPEPSEFSEIDLALAKGLGISPTELTALMDKGDFFNTIRQKIHSHNPDGKAKGLTTVTKETKGWMPKFDIDQFNEYIDRGEKWAEGTTRMIKLTTKWAVLGGGAFLAFSKFAQDQGWTIPAAISGAVGTLASGASCLGAAIDGKELLSDTKDMLSGPKEEESEEKKEIAKLRMQKERLTLQREVEQERKLLQSLKQVPKKNTTKNNRVQSSSQVKAPGERHYDKLSIGLSTAGIVGMAVTAPISLPLAGAVGVGHLIGAFGAGVAHEVTKNQ